MQAKQYKLISKSKILLLALISLVTMVGCNLPKGNKVQSRAVIENENKSSTKTSSESDFNVDVSIKYRIFLDEKVKNVDPNIIKAARTGIFNSDCDFAKFAHYSGYNTNLDILIYDVKELRKDSDWQVYYRAKTPDLTAYDDTGYCIVSVSKEKSGRYIGVESHSSLQVSGDETF